MHLRRLWPLFFSLFAVAAAGCTIKQVDDGVDAAGGAAGTGGSGGDGGSAGSDAGDDGSASDASDEADVSAADAEEDAGSFEAGPDGCVPLQPGPACNGVPTTGLCVCGSTTQIQYCQVPSPGSVDSPVIVTVDCPADYVCNISSVDGVAECLYTKECLAGDRRCNGNDLEVCRADGSGWDLTTCTAGAQQCSTPPGGQTDCYDVVSGSGGTPYTLSGRILFERRSLTKSGLGAVSVDPAFLEFVAIYNGPKYIGSAITDGAGAFQAELSEAATANTTVFVFAMDFYAGSEQPLVAIAHNGESTVANARTSDDYWYWSNKDSCLSGVSVNPGSGRDATMPDLVIPERCGSGAIRIFQYVRYAMYWLGELPATASAKQRSILVLWEPGVEKSCGCCFMGTQFGGGTVTPSGASTSDHYDTIIQMTSTAGSPEEWAYSVSSHETGHWVMANYSRQPGEGGPHTVTGVYKPGLAYSEGFATAFGQRNVSDVAGGEYDPLYLDMQDGTTFWIDISSAVYDSYKAVTKPNPSGPLDQPMNENIVAQMLWHLWHPQAAGAGAYEGLGDDAIFRALTSARVKTMNRGYTTVDVLDFFDAAVCTGVATNAEIDAVSRNLVGYPWDDSAVCP